MPIIYTTTKNKTTGPPYKILSMRQTARSNSAATLDSATSGTSATTNAAAQDTPLPVLRRTILDTVFDDAPLPSLRVPTAQITEINDDEDFPLPTLRTARPPSPEPFEPEDEDLIGGHGDAYNDAAETHGQIEDIETIQNPVPSLIAQSLRREQAQREQSSAALIPSTDRPMTAQTARSFEARTGATIPRASNSNALSRSSTVVTFGDVAPSEAEIYSQAGLLATGKGEKAPERKSRQDENDLRVATHIVSIRRRIEELERKGDAQHHEVLIRLEDIAHNAPATASSESMGTLKADIAGIKARANEGRVAIGKLTDALNDMVDLPREVNALSRGVQGIISATRENESVVNREGNSNNRNGGDLPNSSQREGHGGGFPISAQRDGNGGDFPNGAQHDGNTGGFPNSGQRGGGGSGSHMNGGNRTGSRGGNGSADYDNRGSGTRTCMVKAIVPLLIGLCRQQWQGRPRG
ncbi:hypothetical protein B0H16DRAFT_1454403 [Mycena metata]|uniref:Uncharacterized protein n=1 Tax=Mycena metata TaxID=1033252 RepID=A0AAD7JHX2_9AGAR|nr:hypothetical protein B0H16DRAFT_1454403 [Mycena metata]